MLIQKGAMHMKIYGYIRVSSTDQNEDRQRLASAPSTGGW